MQQDRRSSLTGPRDTSLHTSELSYFRGFKAKPPITKALEVPSAPWLQTRAVAMAAARAWAGRSTAGEYHGTRVRCATPQARTTAACAGLGRTC